MKKIFLLILVFISVQSFGQNVLYAERLNVNGTTDQFFQKPFTDSVFNQGGTFVQFTVAHYEGMYQPVLPNQFGNYHKDADGIYRNFVPRSQTTGSLTYATKANRDKLKDSLQANITLKANASAISNINNTSDLNKPISTATQTALDLKLATNGSAASLTNFPTLNQNTSGTAAGLSTPLSFANGGASGSAATSATTGTMTVNMTTRIITITPSGACTFNASGGTQGQIITFIVTTSGVSSFVLTFGSNFRSTGTLATGTTSARFFAVSFICVNGTIWQEISRTIVQS